MTATIICIVATPASAQKWPEWNKQNVGRGLGAITGAILGSKVGGGSGRDVAIAAGTLAGLWAGGKVGGRMTQIDRQVMNKSTSKAVSTGQTSVWRNPDTGTRTRVSARDYTPRPTNRNLKPALRELPAVELLNTYYTPTKNINVRGGPGTDYEILHNIRKGEPVPVVGKVLNTNWYLIAEQGRASGFLYAPLMMVDQQQARLGNAVRDASNYRQAGRYVAQNSRCRVITQQISLRGGESEKHQFNACQQANGNWVKI